MQIFRFLRFFLRISNTVRSKQLVNSTVRIRIGIIRCSKPIWRWVFTTIYVMHLNIVDFIVSVVRNSTRLQSSQINWYFGSSDATAHKILPSSESCFKENWWCQPEERSGWNGKKKNFYTVQIIKYLRQFLRGIFENILKEWFSLTDYLYFAENTCHFVESLYFWNFFVDDSETQF